MSECEAVSYIERIAQAIWWASGETNTWYPPDEQFLWLGYATLCIAKREKTTSFDVHQAWSAWATIKHNGVHKSLRPFYELTKEVQAYDDLYRDAIRRVSTMLGEKNRLYERDEIDTRQWEKIGLSRNEVGREVIG